LIAVRSTTAGKEESRKKGKRGEKHFPISPFRYSSIEAAEDPQKEKKALGKKKKKREDKKRTPSPNF